jgi:FAD/FMN-containing dehydrogenase
VKRRTFCQGTLAAGLSVAIPGCTSKSGNPAAATIAALNADGAEIEIETAALGEFAGEFAGQLLMPTDNGYEAAKKIWNGMFDHKRPALVAQCANAGDVATAVRFARERNLLVAVKGGGHSLPGKSTCDGGLMIDLSRLQSTRIDIDARTLRVDGGALLGHIDNASHPHQLGTTTGIVSHTGAGGFTLGGGYGRTDRLMGLAVDNLLAATVVTADGNVVRASAADDSELFWAIRGGGGNFGIATEFVYKLHPFNPVVYGGTVLFELSEQVLNFYGELAAELPNEANVEPQIYVAEGGARHVEFQVVYSGDHSEGARVVAAVTKLAKPLAVDLGPFEYKTMQTGGDVFMGHGRQYYLKSGLLASITPDISKIIVDHVSRDNPPGAWFQHLGGVQTQVAPNAMAYSHRNALLNLGIMIISDDPATMDGEIAKARAFYSDIEPYRIGFYTNLNEDTDARTHSNFGGNYDRLVAAKNKYDPTNLFRLNANIRPTV